MEDGKAEETEAAGEPGSPGKPRLPEENEAHVVGRIVNNLKMKEGSGANGGYKMARFTLAVNISYQDSSRKWVRETDFVPVVAWGKRAEEVGKAGKGTAMRVTGRIKTWQVEGKGYRWELKADKVEILDLRRPTRAESDEAQKELMPS